MLKKRERELAVIRVKVLEEATTSNFALDFLAIYNIVRENKDVFLKFEMHYDSDLLFVVQKKDTDKVVDWLKKTFSETWNMDTLEITNEVRTVIQDWDDDFNEDILLTDKVNIEEL